MRRRHLTPNLRRRGAAPAGRPARKPRRGLTLVELAVSVGLLSLVMAAAGAAVVVATRAIPDGTSAAEAAVASAAGADQLADELHYALTVPDASPRAVTFTVADRNNDAINETIRYEWSGVAGDPLKRSYNNQTAVPVLQDVREFSLAYNRHGVNKTTQETTETTTDEVLLDSFTAWTGLTATSQNYAPTTTSWATQYFYADLIPSGAKRVRVTRVLLMMKGVAAGASNFTVGVHRSAGGGAFFPATNPIGTPADVSSTLGTAGYVWTEVQLPNAVVESLARDFVIVVKGKSSPNLNVQNLNHTSAPANDTAMSWTTTSGGSWSPASRDQNKYDMPFYAYGTYTTSQTKDVVTTTWYLKSVTITMRTGTDAGSRSVATVPVLEHPLVAAP